MTGARSPARRESPASASVVAGALVALGLLAACGFWTLIGLVLNSCSFDTSECTPTIASFIVLVVPGIVASGAAVAATVNALRRRWERYWRALVVVFGAFAISWGIWIFSAFFTDDQTEFFFAVLSSPWS